ncbi:hypothetical protein ACA910_012639 [Epithemia clementina (nom. ined.)]
MVMVSPPRFIGVAAFVPRIVPPQRGIVVSRFSSELSFHAVLQKQRIRSTSTTSLQEALPGRRHRFIPFTTHQPSRTLSTNTGALSAASSYDDDDDDKNRRCRFILNGLNSAQIEAVTRPTQSCTLVVAGPGSGKTRALTCRIAYLLQQPTCRHERILAVTFTKKAAGEMNLRLKKILTSMMEEEEEQQQQQQQQQSQQQQYGDDYDEEQQALAFYDAVAYEEEETEASSATAPGVWKSEDVSRQLGRVTMGTFHSVCAKILRWNAAALATLPSVAKHTPVGVPPVLDRQFAIADPSDQLRVLKEVLKDMDISPANVKGYEKAILDAISYAKEEFSQGRNPFDTRKVNLRLSERMRFAATCYDPYRQKLFMANQLDFDDLIYLTRELLTEHETIRDAVRRRWNHVLVDEFQDTSLSQLDLIKLLTTNSLLVVGDPDQSIYSWRGAHVSMMQDFPTHFPRVDTVDLMENYRSTSNIVKAAQKVINAGDGIRQNMIPQREAGDMPRIISCADGKDEANFVIGAIKKAVKSGNYTDEHEVAVLYRTNAQSRELEEACVEHNLPYVLYGSAAFYQRKEVKDCLCFLRWLTNGRDRGAMERAMKTPPRGIGDAAIKEFDQYCQDVTNYYQTNFPNEPRPTMLDVLFAISDDTWLKEGSPLAMNSIATRSRKALHYFSKQMCDIYNFAQKQPVQKLIAHVVDTLDLFRYLKKESSTESEFEERKSHVQELQQASERYNGDGPSLGSNFDRDQADQNFEELALSPLSTFLEGVSLVDDLATASQEKKAQQRFVACLMTVHASKGMEFDTVYIVGNEENTFPTAKATKDDYSGVLLEEERRLCYVAMTRAKSELIMTWRKEVTIFRSEGMRKVKSERSRFLNCLLQPSKKHNGARHYSNDSKAKSPNTNNVYSTSKSKSFGKTRNGASSTRSKSPESLGPSTTSVYSKTSALENTMNGAANHRTLSSESHRFGRDRHFTASVYSAANPQTPPSYGPKKQGASFANRKYSSGSFSAEPRQVPNTKVSEPRSRSKNVAGTRTASTQRLYNPSMTNNFGNSKSISSQSSTAPTPQANDAASTKKNVIDSNWFYPVGTSVVHKTFGRGIVLRAPQPTKEIDMPLLVEFPSGDQRIFSARGSDVSPVVHESKPSRAMLSRLDNTRL